MGDRKEAREEANPARARSKSGPDGTGGGGERREAMADYGLEKGEGEGAFTPTEIEERDEKRGEGRRSPG
jgi:hypothetical protein